jgi:hypothetical protein
MGPETVHQSIIEFLNSARTNKATTTRCCCGAIMKEQTTTFFYDGQSWEVQLPICPDCRPAPRAPRHDA